MKEKQIRLCLECGKQHNTGIEDRIEGTFEPVDTCIDCLMGKCSFKFESRQITLDDIAPLSYDEMQTQLGETVLNVLQTEYGSSSPIGCANAKIYDAKGNEMDIKCKCGNDATSVIMGRDAYMGLCNKCQYGE